MKMAGGIRHLRNRGERFFFPCRRQKLSSIMYPLAVMVSLILLFSWKTAFGDEEIDPRSGWLSLSEIDLEVPAGPITLKIQRTLQTQEERSGLLGSRWRLNWESELVRSDSLVGIMEAAGPILIEYGQGTSETKVPLRERVVTEEEGRTAINWPDGSKAAYDESGRLVETQDANGNKTTLKYDRDHRLTRIIGPRGAYLKVNTDDKGLITIIEASNGAKVRYDYDERDLVQVQVDGGPPVKYSYDDKWSLVRIERPKSGAVELAYDGEGRVIGRRWADGSEEFYEYDDSRNRVRHIDAAGGITTTQRSPDGRREEIIDAMGNKTVIKYNESSHPVSVTSPTGVTSRMEYDSQGRITEIEGCCGDRARFEYVGELSLIKSIAEHDGTQYSFTYDDRWNLLSIERGGELIYALTYYPGGLVRSMRGIDSPERTFTYYPNGLLKSETDLLGQTTTYEYDQRGNLVREINALGGATVRVYDEQNRLVSVTDPSGAKTQFAYDAAGHCVQKTDPTGGVSHYEFDSRGQLLSMTDPAGRTTGYRYDTTGRLISEIDPAGNTYRYQYDLVGNLIREINPLGGVTQWSYNPLGLVVNESDPTGRTWQYKYSDAGYLTQIVDPLGGTTEYRYDVQGQCSEVVDPAGRKTRYEFDRDGRISKVLFPDGLINTYVHDRDGNVIKAADNRGWEAGYEFDALGRLVRERKASGLEISYRYDALENMLGWRDNLGGGVNFQYNAQELVSAMRDVTGASTRYRCDLQGRLLEEISPLGHITRRSYTAGGELSQVNTPSGDVTQFTNDPSGALSEIHHPCGGVTRLAYDPMGNLTELENPLGAKTRNVYDEAGWLVSVTDAKGQTTTFAYDRAGRLVKKRLADGKIVDYKYDVSGSLVEIDDGSFPVRYSYNKGGLLNRIEYPAIKRTLRYEYDETGRLSKFIDSEGDDVRYEYNDTGLLGAMQFPDGQGITFGYDVRGRLTSVAYPNGIQGIWEYDVLDRPIRITYEDEAGERVLEWRYSYDAAGELLEIVDAGGKVIQYQYDSIGQILQEQRSSETTRYSYLPGGNRGEMEKEGKTVEYRYNQADQLAEAGKEAFRYDANGNLIERRSPQGITTYQYDVEDRLVRVAKPDGKEVSFGYAPTGERIWRRDSSGLTWFITDGMNLLGELDEDLKPKARYLHGPGIDWPLVLLEEGRNHFYHSDHLGGIGALTDSNGELSASYQTDAFGNLLEQKTRVHNPFVFTGREYESDIGLYYYRARYYDPEFGRFLSEDPVWDPFELNLYAYVRNAPTGYRDPLGSQKLPRRTLPPGLLKERGITYEQFMNRLVNPGIKRLELGPTTKALPRTEIRRFAWNMAVKNIEKAPSNFKGQRLISALRHDLAIDIAKYRHYQRHGVPDPTVKGPTARLPTGNTTTATRYGTWQEPSFKPLPEKYRGSRLTHTRHQWDKGKDITLDSNPPSPKSGPKGPGAGGAAAGAPGGKPESSSMSVRQEPGRPHQLNAEYKGSRGAKSPANEYNSKKLPPRTPGSGGEHRINTKSTGKGWARKVIGDEKTLLKGLALLLTLEHINNCFHQRMSSTECAEAFIKGLMAAGVVTVAGVSLVGATPTLIAGLALIIATRVSQVPELYAERDRLEDSKFHQELAKRRLEYQQNIWKNSQVRLSKLNKRMDEHMVPLLQEARKACDAIRQAAGEAQGKGKAAEEMAAKIPKDLRETVMGAVNRCSTALDSESSIIMDLEPRIKQHTETVIQGFEAANGWTASCDSLTVADRIKRMHRECEGLVSGVVTLANRAQSKNSIIIECKGEASKAKGALVAAMGQRDKIITLHDEARRLRQTFESRVAIFNNLKGSLLAERDGYHTEIGAITGAFPAETVPLGPDFGELKAWVSAARSRATNMAQVTCDIESQRQTLEDGIRRALIASEVARTRVSGEIEGQLGSLTKAQGISVEGEMGVIMASMNRALEARSRYADLPQQADACAKRVVEKYKRTQDQLARKDDSGLDSEAQQSKRTKMSQDELEELLRLLEQMSAQSGDETETGADGEGKPTFVAEGEIGGDQADDAAVQVAKKDTRFEGPEEVTGDDLEKKARQPEEMIEVPEQTQGSDKSREAGRRLGEAIGRVLSGPLEKTVPSDRDRRKPSPPKSKPPVIARKPEGGPPRESQDPFVGTWRMRMRIEEHSGGPEVLKDLEEAGISRQQYANLTIRRSGDNYLVTGLSFDVKKVSVRGNTITITGRERLTHRVGGLIWNEYSDETLQLSLKSGGRVLEGTWLTEYAPDRLGRREWQRGTVTATR